MSNGSGVQKRARMNCVHAFRLKQSGMTNREIAATLGKSIDAIPGMLKVGERFSDDPALHTIKQSFVE